ISFPRKSFYRGKWIRHGGWYPNYTLRAADRRYARWTEPHLHEQLQVDGPIYRTRFPIHHYTFQSVEDQIRTNLRYAREGAKDLQTRKIPFSFFLMVLKPIGKFLETYFLKKGCLDGLTGFIIAANAAHSMFL